VRDTPEVSYLEIGSVGSMPLRIPVVTIGSGRPVLSILCGIHGDETASTFSAYQFLKCMAQEPELNGTVQLVPSANPFAQATRTRVAVSDLDNLNRTGKGDPDGRMTQRIANALFEFLKDSTLVIDLHEFRMTTPRMVVYIPDEKEETRQINLSNIAAFEPAFVWALSGASSDSGSLIAALVAEGVPGFGIETSDAHLMTDDEISKVVAGLYRVAQNLAILPGTFETRPVTAYNARFVSADQAGIWCTRRCVFEEVEEGELIGHLIPFPLVTEETVDTPYSGTLLQVAPHRLVDTGSYIFSVGETDKLITEELHRAAKRKS